MDQSYFRFLFLLARKSKQSGLSKSEKSLAKRNAAKIINVFTNFLMLSDTSLFIKYFSFYGCFEGVLDFANKFKNVT